VLVYLGKSSYAMYIVHVPVMWWYLRESKVFSPGLYVAAVIAVSAIVYGAFEEPANRWLRGRWRIPPANRSARSQSAAI
jgi:peptidoglycan/LPS O-acetylase OafA/YrhL